MFVVEMSSMGAEILLRIVPAEKECLVVRLREGMGAVFCDLDPLRVVKARERAIVGMRGGVLWMVVCVLGGSTVGMGKFRLFLSSCFLFLLGEVVSYCCSRCADTVQRVMNLIKMCCCMGVVYS